MHDIKLVNIEKTDFGKECDNFIEWSLYKILFIIVFTFKISKSIGHAHLKNFASGMCWLYIYIYIYIYVYKTLLIFKKYIATYDTLQHKVSLYTKWFHWILSEFICLVNKD
jgi:hypothetical protein